MTVGSGTSSGAGISGMWSLGNYLVGNVKTNDFEAEDLLFIELFCLRGKAEFELIFTYYREIKRRQFYCYPQKNSGTIDKRRISQT